MNNENKDVSSALDDIFGSDFVNIDSNIKENEVDKKTMFDEEIEKSTDEQENKTLEKFDEEKSDKVKTSEKKSKKIVYIITLILLILIVVGVFFIYSYNNSKRIYVANCTYSASDNGYKIKDEYIITYKKHGIQKIDMTYKYEALNAEFEKQIEFIKEEKMPVIINSNGMDGFTYLYESSVNSILINGYLDFTLFDFKEINKFDQKVSPISFFEIKPKLTYDKLKKELESKGYICRTSK